MNIFTKHSTPSPGPFDCVNCPRNNDPTKGRFCPAWTQYQQENPVTGETRLAEECWFQAAPKFMIEVIKASNRPAAAVESTRNVIAEGFVKVGAVMDQAVNTINQAVSTLQIEQDKTPWLEKRDD